MTSPTITRVHLLGHFEDLLGRPLKGKKLTFRFRPYAVTFVGNNTIVPSEPVPVVLDVNGSFDVALPVGGDPTEWTYSIAELFGARREYEILLQPPGPWNLADLAPSAQSTGVVYKQGPPGPVGTGQPYVYTQSAAAATWTINHNLNKYPVVLLFIGGKQVYADVDYPSLNQVVITLPAPASGQAHLL